MTKSPMPAAEPMSQEIVERLKECPFCGADKVYPQEGDLFDGKSSFIWCSKCNCRSRECLAEADAVAAWNARTLTNLTPSGVERIAAIVDPEARWGAPRGRADLDRQAIARQKARAITTLALPSEPPSQGDVEGRAREAWQPIETDEVSHPNDAICPACGFRNNMPLELLSGDWNGLECGRCGEAFEYRGHATGDTSQGEFEIKTRALATKEDGRS